MLFLFIYSIFKDRKRLDEWILQNGDSSEESGLSEEESFSQPSRISYTLSAKETGYFFILFKYSKKENEVSKMNLGMIISRKVYDVDSSVFSCSAGADEACSARLLFGSSEVGVLEVTQNLDYHSNDRESDMWYHFDYLRALSSDCNIIMELGTRSVVSTWAFLQSSFNSVV